MLTNTQLRSLKPRAKLYRVADGAGLCVEVKPTGSKLWRYRYRFGSKPKMLSLGAYPEITLAEARQRHAQARKTLHKGIDPSEQRRHAKAAAEHAASERFETIAREWYAVRRPNWRSTHSSKVIRRLERDIFPFLGHKTITGITGPELLAVVLRVAKRGATETARRELSYCGMIYRFAIAGGRAESDIAHALWDAMPKAQGKHLVYCVTNK
jgi:hypothetical protein